MSQQGGDVSLARDSQAEQVVSSVISQLQQQHQQQQLQHQEGVCQQQSSNSAEDDQVMVATERDLAEDAQWKRIQQNTFTRWANEHLKTVDKFIGSLETDLSDGLKLIALVEVLSGKKLPKHTKKPTFRSQKLENVSVALKFLEHDEGIRIVNIDSSDIVDCKLKLILGLIWTLILHYSISMPMWEGDDGSRDGKGPTPKQRLMGWIQSKIPDMPITNFTNDWNDGRAIGALVDGVAPGLCPDWNDWDPKDALQNATEAMGLADDWLKIPQLVKPEEMVNPNVDELSMMTYLSQYPNAKLQPNAPLRPKANPNRPAPPRVRAYGPGVEPTGPVVGAPANFTVETFSAGKGNVEVLVEDPRGQKIPAEVKFNNDRNLSYACSYKPLMEGVYRVVVKYNGLDIPKSPFEVKVEGHAGDASKVTASGPGLEPEGVIVNRPTYFDIFTKDAGKGVPEVIVLDAAGQRNTVPVKLRQISPEVWRCEYVANSVGVHSINVFFAGQPIPKSPFGVRVSPVSDARKVRASGRGIQPNGVRVRDVADFRVHTEGAGEGQLDIRVIGPGGSNEPVKLRKIDEHTTEAVYHPVKEGRHVVMVSYGGQEIPKSPFEVNVGPYKETDIVVYGPGLYGGVVDHPALFTVETNGNNGALGFSIEGPSQAKIECHDNGDGSADVRYYPVAPGEYAVHILCDNEDIPKSPYMANILPKSNYYPDKVECFGPGLEKTGVLTGKLAPFTVDTRKSGDTSVPVNVSVMDVDYHPVPVNKVEKAKGLYECNYVPERGVKHTVQVNQGGVAVKNSPFRVYVSAPTDSSKVQVFGPGVEKGVKSNTPTHFNVDARDAGPGDLNVNITNDKGQPVPVQVDDNGDGTYSVAYTPSAPGPIKVNVLYAGKLIPRSPIAVQVQPHVDVSKVKIDGLEPTVFLDSPTEFTVDSRAVPKKPGDGPGKVTCLVHNPSGSFSEPVITSQPDGQNRVAYTPFEEGPHKIDVMYDGVPVPGSPFTVNARRGCDPSKVKAFGPGLERGVVNEPNIFTIETKGAGSGGLGLAIEGPSEAKMTCRDNRDGSCTVEYIPTEAGDYDISIKFADQFIPGSPFKVPVDRYVDANSVRAYGPGLEPNNCRANIPQRFKIDATKSGKAPLAVDIRSDRGPLAQKPEIIDHGDGTYDVTYMPPPENSTCKVRVTYGGKDIPKSPFEMKVRPTVEPKNVKVTGPGVSSKGIPASIPADFVVDTTEAGYGDLQVQVLGPDGYPRKVKVSDNGDGTFKATYTPDDLGQYKVNVKYGGKEVPHAPFNVQAHPTGRAESCKITEGIQQTLSIGEEYCISVNAKNAGNGAVTCRIRGTSGSDMDIDIDDNGDGTFSVYYTVKDAGEYTLSIKFGGNPVPDGVYNFTAQSGDEPVKRSPSNSQYRPVELHNIPLPTTGGQVTGEVKMPSGKVDKALIKDNRDGTVSIQYEPHEEGLHELHIHYNSEHVQGSPFKFFVDSLQSGLVTAYGSGLTHGVCGEACNFTISTKNAGSGGLSLAVEGPSKADIGCTDNKDGTVSVSYLPLAPGEYKVSVKYADKHITGSPFTSKITGEGRKRNQISVGSNSEVPLPAAGRVADAELRALNASIQAPSGLEEPCFLKMLPNGNLGISFTPREIGDHYVSVKKLGKQIQGSPFKIKVGEREVGDAKKVLVSGKALLEGKTHTDNTFNVDTRKAGYGGLSLSIEGPSKAEIKCKDNENGTLDISYRPTEPGYYIMNLKFADHHVDGSPFTMKVTGEGSNTQTERIKRERTAVPQTEVGSKCRLAFKIPGVSTMDLSACVTSPSGVTEGADIGETEDGSYGVSFVPTMLGVHTVSVKYNDVHIPGSPFQFTVGPLRDGGSHRVHAGGPGLERGEQGQPCEFNVWTREAGAGSLAISVEGPSKAQIDFKDRKDGSCYVVYNVSEPGEYRVGVKFNDKHIPDSPFRVYISPEQGDAHKIEIGQFPDSGCAPNKPQAFIVRKNGAKGEFDAKVVSPSGSEDDCFISAIDTDIYSVRFLPRDNGVHYVHVKFNGVHIPGSPFPLKVGKEDADPAAVHAAGPGLIKSLTGHKTDFIVNTCSAGCGTLAVTIDGPSKASMDCTDVEEGYKVRYTPLVPGDYFIAVKYNGFHIVGSPFRVPCTGELLASKGVTETSSVMVETVTKVSKKSAQAALPVFKSDASKVTSKGMGLKKAYMNKQNTFSISASDAGANLLFVAVYGPKGPCEEVFVKHLGHNSYQVTYAVRDRGDYVIIVKWGEDHIPGSPFKVEV
ncbi:filamin-A isoform X1 [Daphnia magna]|uniref:filamin-A isoform X1 n=1 Tax=Daphnia magna TaxID=35525 RepID=UPI001E1BBAA5|nr:filamin-A isoform X1 [Daphnia magna]XP_045034747.1 filamin-A isoform X1 [Daphnia magna]